MRLTPSFMSATLLFFGTQTSALAIGSGLSAVDLSKINAGIVTLKKGCSEVKRSISEGLHPNGAAVFNNTNPKNAMRNFAKNANMDANELNGFCDKYAGYDDKAGKISESHGKSVAKEAEVRQKMIAYKNSAGALAATTHSSQSAVAGSTGEISAKLNELEASLGGTQSVVGSDPNSSETAYGQCKQLEQKFSNHKKSWDTNTTPTFVPPEIMGKASNVKSSVSSIDLVMRNRICSAVKQISNGVTEAQTVTRQANSQLVSQSATAQNRATDTGALNQDNLGALSPARQKAEDTKNLLPAMDESKSKFDVNEYYKTNNPLNEADRVTAPSAEDSLPPTYEDSPMKEYRQNWDAMKAEQNRKAYELQQQNEAAAVQKAAEDEAAKKYGWFEDIF